MMKAKAPPSPSSDDRASSPIAEWKSKCPEKRVIVIDPGHGGSDNNAVAVSGPLEKELTLIFAQSLRTQLLSGDVQKLFKAKGYDVKLLMTRESDMDVSFDDRVKLATDNKADIFLSIHFNAFGPSVRGTETLYRDPASGGNKNVAEDMSLAQAVNDALYGALKSMDEGADDRGIQPDSISPESPVAVLRDPGIGLSGKMCRSALVEVEFITNESADKLLVSGPKAAANRDTAMRAVAEALAKAL